MASFAFGRTLLQLAGRLGLKPRDLDKAYIAQSRNVGTETTNSTRTKAEDFAYLAAEERIAGTENSHVILLANVTSQSKKILLDRVDALTIS